MKNMEKHLEGITAHDLNRFRNERYLEMAFVSGRGGNYAIGVCGNGDFAVKDGLEWFHFSTAEQAVEAYKKLLTNP